MKGYGVGGGRYGNRGQGSTGSRGTGTGSSTNSCARHPRSARKKAVKNRTKTGAVSGRPMEYTYRDIPFGSPRANIRGL